MTIEYEVEINGSVETGLTAMFADDGVITVEVQNDDAFDGDDAVVVTLTGVTIGNAVLGTQVSASATVTEDDALSDGTVVYRVNAGGPEVAAIDGGPDWTEDQGNNASPYLIVKGSDDTAGFPGNDPGPTVPATVPGVVFDTERWDDTGGNDQEMQWAFDVLPGTYEVRLYMGNGFGGTSAPGDRVFDVALEGSVPVSLDDIDLSAQFGHQVGGLIAQTVEVTDGTLNIEFLHDVKQNPLVNAIEIVQTAPADFDFLTTFATPAVREAAFNQIKALLENGIAGVEWLEAGATNVAVLDEGTGNVVVTSTDPAGDTGGLSWSESVFTFDADGDRLSKVTDLDDGSIATRTFGEFDGVPDQPGLGPDDQHRRAGRHVDTRFTTAPAASTRRASNTTTV